MGRPLRIQYPGAFYHVTSRGNERRDIFKSRRDREKFLEYLASATERHGARIHAYALMSNHYHLMVETPEGNLSEIMRHINGAYTNYFNTKRRRFGHLLQGRYRAILVERDAYALELSRYLHLNPVRARMVERPGDYEWTSYRSYIGVVEAPDWLIRELVASAMGSRVQSAQESYRRFVEAAEERELPDPLEGGVASTLLGSTSFVEWVKNKFLQERPADRDVPALKALTERPSIEAIRNVVERNVEDGPRTKRRLSLYLCHRLSGRRLREIGAAFGVGPSAVTEASRRVEVALSNSTDLARVVDALKRELRV